MAIENLDNHIKTFKHRNLLGGPLYNYYYLEKNYEVIKNYFDRPTERKKEDILKDLKRFTNTKDITRNESFVQTFPHYKEWFESL
jgi:hypothetical protein